MPGLLVRCRMCGREFEPSGDEILAGTWQVCAACRADGAPKPAPREEQNHG